MRSYLVTFSSLTTAYSSSRTANHTSAHLPARIGIPYRWKMSSFAIPLKLRRLFSFTFSKPRVASVELIIFSVVAPSVRSTAGAEFNICDNVFIIVGIVLGLRCSLCFCCKKQLDVE